MIIERLEVGPFSTNCYIVGAEAGGEGLIIDPGDKAGRILKRAEEHKLDIKLIVLTHGHIDHTGALKKVKEKTGVEVAIHADDAESMGKQPMEISAACTSRCSTPRGIARAGYAWWGRGWCSAGIPCSATASAGPTSMAGTMINYWAASRLS